MDNDILHRLIDKYFEGDTSLEEEKMLLELLMESEPEDEAVRSTLAVMGYSRLSPSDGNRVKKPLSKWRYRFAGIAAACAVAAVCVTVVLTYPLGSGADHCLAYVAGEKIESRDVVVELMELQLGEFSEAATEIDKAVMDDFSEMGTILDSNDVL